MMGQLPAQQNTLSFTSSAWKSTSQTSIFSARSISFSTLIKPVPTLTPYYSHTGRPSIDPELVIRMLLIGYCYGIRSERRICEEIRYNLAYRWFCRLGLEEFYAIRLP